MKVYLVQHGEAMPKSVNAERPLTEQGEEAVQRVASLAGRMSLRVHQVRHSGKTRAEQTAAILGEALSPPSGVVAVSGLMPRDDVRPVAEALGGELRPVMLVGHLPFVTRLAGLLVTGDPNRPVVRFKQGAIVCLERGDDRWLVSWILTPEMAAAQGT
jgi:phosphohistidine phosphatase